MSHLPALWSQPRASNIIAVLILHKECHLFPTPQHAQKERGKKKALVTSRLAYKLPARIFEVKLLWDGGSQPITAARMTAQISDLHYCCQALGHRKWGMRMEPKA